jgi:hypothetical protein
MPMPSVLDNQDFRFVPESFIACVLPVTVVWRVSDTGQVTAHLIVEYSHLEIVFL